MSGISTHVLDTSIGRPARSVCVSLERLDSSGVWLQLATAKTNEDGRCAQLLPQSDGLSAGRYRLIFDTARYFADRNVTGLYPAVEINFEVRDGESHYHIPLLLGPNSYTTYRGS